MARGSFFRARKLGINLICYTSYQHAVSFAGQLDTTNFPVIEYNATINVEEAAMNDSRGSYFRGEAEDFAYQIGIIRSYCDSMLRNDTLYRQIRDLKPDLVVIDNLPQVSIYLHKPSTK